MDGLVLLRAYACRGYPYPLLRSAPATPGARIFSSHGSSTPPSHIKPSGRHRSTAEAQRRFVSGRARKVLLGAALRHAEEEEEEEHVLH